MSTATTPATSRQKPGMKTTFIWHSMGYLRITRNINWAVTEVRLTQVITRTVLMVNITVNSFWIKWIKASIRTAHKNRIYLLWIVARTVRGTSTRCESHAREHSTARWMTGQMCRRATRLRLWSLDLSLPRKVIFSRNSKRKCAGIGSLMGNVNLEMSVLSLTAAMSCYKSRTSRRIIGQRSAKTFSPTCIVLTGKGANFIIRSSPTWKDQRRNRNFTLKVWWKSGT